MQGSTAESKLLLLSYCNTSVLSVACTVCLTLTVGVQVGIAFVDKDYPARAAFGIVTRVLDEYSDQSRDAWRTATADTNDAVAMLEAAVSKYQARTLAAT